MQQGSALRSYLFFVVMDGIIKKEIQCDVICCMMYANDIVLVEDNRAKVTIDMMSGD